MTRRVAVAAPGHDPVDAALSVAAAGGNAVDAAVAAVITATVTEPGLVSPMGGAFVNVWAPGDEPVVVDGNVEMPGRAAAAERFTHGVDAHETGYFGGLTIYGGAGTVATPGMFAALDRASGRWGVLPWAEVMAPAIDVARRGFRLGGASAYYLGTAGDTLFAADPETKAYLRQDGTLPVMGQTLLSPQLAATFETIAADGVSTLYSGELARLLAADLAGRGGLLGLADLQEYRTVTRPALRSRLHAWDIAANPPPSVGGPVLTTMLRLLADRRRTRGATDASDVVDIQRTVLGYRYRAIDRAHDLETAGRELLELLDTLGPAGLEAVCSSPETIHVSVVDSDGLACAITTSSGYGSGVTVPGTGLMLNNALGEPELNRRGLHALRPGTRLASNMAPATARRDDGAVLAIGSPGADRITTALFQVLGGVCLDDHPLQEAIDAPRAHVVLDGDGSAHLEYEPGVGLAEIAAATGMRAVAHERLAMFFGGVGACLRHPDSALEAAGDPRREAATGVG
ncbi:gamma-glutamyltransferase [Agilicoccus flavus]|uniref:gamma-glutamyltransferase n=1 Tax=Agilicoccus flavus TaxID=2775968 RepID=UPI001CF6FC47|nr:gamma-glutamyltransferase [Agilicoccus flavus]